MEFGRFGIKSFTAETKAGDFVTYLEQGKVATTKCSQCGKEFFPPKFLCPYCGGEEVEWVEVAGTGRVITFTTVYYGPAGFENETPYTIAIAEFPGPVQLLGHIDRSVAKEAIGVGMKVKPVPVRKGDRCWYQFEPADHT